jgi:hypothetical protein
MSTSPDDINALLAGAGLNKPITPVDPGNPVLPAFGSQQGNNGAFDPSTVQAMLALHGQANAQGNIARQRKLADQMRADASGLMGTKQAGRVTVGPKWYDALANVAANAQATRQDVQSDEASAGLDRQYGKTMQDIIDEYNRKARGL